MSSTTKWPSAEKPQLSDPDRLHLQISKLEADRNKWQRKHAEMCEQLDADAHKLAKISQYAIKQAITDLESKGRHRVGGFIEIGHDRGFYACCQEAVEVLEAFGMIERDVAPWDQRNVRIVNRERGGV